MTPASRVDLSPLEIACGTVYGFDPDLPPIDVAAADSSPRRALENVIAAALSRAPCVVSFSGGRDSSAVLAVATQVARDRGLPLPIPVSLVFPQASLAAEDEWQELVISRLQLPDWHRLIFTDELDIVGDLARATLARHGLQWPFNAYFHVPIMQLARGGSVLTGVGGDELFSAGTWHRENLVLSRRARPLALDPARFVLSASPRVVKHRYLKAKLGPEKYPRTWLTPAANAEAIDRRVDSIAVESLSFRRTLARSWWPRRSRLVSLQALAELAADVEAQCVSPLCAPEVLGAIMKQQGWRAFDNRSRAMAELVGDLLPVDLTSRPTKAGFAQVFFNRAAREFADAWDGTGLDPAIVNAPELQRIWRTEELPDARTYTMMQYLVQQDRQRSAGQTRTQQGLDGRQLGQ